jgi:ABC-type multidrug transport system fused ATPase/permease subunit
MKNLWRALKLVLPHRGMLMWYLISTVGLSIFGGSPIILAKAFIDKIQGNVPKDKLGVFVNDILTGYFGNGDAYLKGLCAIILVMLIGNCIFEFLNSYITSWLAQRLRIEAMDRVMRKLLSLDQPFYDKQKTGDLVSRMVSDGDNLRKTVKIFLDFLEQPFRVIVLAGIAIYYDRYLFLLGAIGLPVVILPFRKVIKNITKQTTAFALFTRTKRQIRKPQILQNKLKACSAPD